MTSEQRGLNVSNTQNRYFDEYFTKMQCVAINQTVIHKLVIRFDKSNAI